MILIGSRALAIRAPNLLGRTPVDFDFVCTESEVLSWLSKNYHKVGGEQTYAEKNKVIVRGKTNCEFEIIKPGTSSELLVNLVSNDSNTLETPFGLIPNLDLLFTIKASHKYLKNSPYFWKTVVDYHILKMNGATIKPKYQQFFKLREKETYTYSHPKLNQSKESFFSDDNINYIYDHDSIHEAVALYDRPAYTYYMKDGEAVQCDKSKFFSIDEKYRLAGVIEESAVLAIERSLVPHPGKMTPQKAWKFALSKVCSSITSGWFREYGYENILSILKMYPDNYWDKFQNALNSNKIRPFTGSKY